MPPVEEAMRAAVEEHRDTGAMIESVGVLKKGGIVSTADGAEGKVGFNGYDAKGVANDLKANVIEYGTSRRKAKPFLSKVKRAAQKDVEAAMQSVLDKEVGTS